MSGRFDVFHSLDADKQKRILQAALQEFASKGYKRASTNTIAATAEIGKGMLFYYFGSKEELFDFLCEHTLEYARTTYLHGFQLDSGDFLERCIMLTKLKRRAIDKNPAMIAFFESFFHQENAPYFKKFSAEISKIRQDLYNKIYGNLDYSLFRKDLNGMETVRYLQWLMNGYEHDITERFKRAEISMSDEAAIAQEWQNFYAFVDNLRLIFYKEEKDNDNH